MENSVVAVADDAEVRVLADEGGSRLIPSVVSFHPSGHVVVEMPVIIVRNIDESWRIARSATAPSARMGVTSATMLPLNMDLPGHQEGV